MSLWLPCGLHGFAVPNSVTVLVLMRKEAGCRDRGILRCSARSRVEGLVALAHCPDMGSEQQSL